NLVRGAALSRACGLAVLVSTAAAPAAFAAATRIWVCESAGDFSSGEARGVAVAMNGNLVLSRESHRVDGISEATLFSAVSDREGNVILGTGNEGKILRVSTAGRVDTLATLPSKEVTALA